MDKQQKVQYQQKEDMHKKAEKQQGEYKNEEEKNQNKVDVIQKLIKFRRLIHQYPQIGFDQFKTRDRIINILKEFGVVEDQMKKLEPTALVVDLRGKAAPSGEQKCVAFRADMDALTMVEANYDLEYRSKIQGVAHMCGHDGHITCLVGFVPKFLKYIDKIPSDRMIRLLFQPSEQGPGPGSKVMIEQGCLQGVDQVYGFHNWPTAPLGQLWCKQGPVMSEITVLEIKIIGTGGHGSQPESLKESLRAAIKFYQRALDYLDNLKKQKDGNFVCTLPIFQAGQRFNVISESVFISGSIRSFEVGLNHIIIAKLTEFLEDIKKEGFNYTFTHRLGPPVNFNTKQQADHVLRVGKKILGEENVGKGKLPFRATENFSFFTKIKPGAFFFFSSARSDNQAMLHSNKFDFNDNLIDPASSYWLQLAKDRLGIN